MRVGVTMFFQGYEDWDRYEARERGESVPPLDPEFDARRYNEELEMALEVEELGFDSIWTIEHHVSPYTMVTNPLQMLSFIAGATKKVDVGTMVVVVPWHHPLRIAEDMAMLQYHLRGRTPYIGFGRGAARREFNQLGFDMNESKERFHEGVEIIKLALSNEVFSYKGKYYDFENVTLRPRPRDAQALLENLHFSWGSPSSAPVGARLGLKPMIIPQKPWDDYHADLDAFTAARAESGFAPVRPRIHMNCFVGETEAEAEKYALAHIPEYADSAVRNYELGSRHFATTRGYEHYALLADAMTANNLTPGQTMARTYVDNHVWGTPEQCIAKFEKITAAFHPEEYMLVLRYGSMTKAVADKSMRLFASEVLPALQEIKVLEAVA